MDAISFTVPGSLPNPAAGASRGANSASDRQAFEGALDEARASQGRAPRDTRPGDDRGPRTPGRTPATPAAKATPARESAAPSAGPVARRQSALTAESGDRTEPESSEPKPEEEPEVGVVGIGGTPGPAAPPSDELVPAMPAPASSASALCDTAAIVVTPTQPQVEIEVAEGQPPGTEPCRATVAAGKPVAAAAGSQAVPEKAQAVVEDAPAQSPNVEMPVQPEKGPREATAAGASDTSEPCANATVPIRAARAYLKAVRSIENPQWFDGLPAAVAARMTEPADANPLPERPAAPVEGQLQPPAAMSARAVAVLRSLGLTDGANTSEPRPAVAPTDSPFADVMTGVAIELAAAGAGDGHSDTSDPPPGEGRQNARRTEGAAVALSHTASTFAVAAHQAETAPGDVKTVTPVLPASVGAPDVPVPGQIVKAIALAWKDGVGEARIRLTPEHLGEVLVSMKVERGQVVAQVVAETAAARTWIETHQQDLRDGLSQQGLQLDRLVVTADGQRQQQQRQDDGSDRPRRSASRGRGGESVPRFEVHV